MTASAIGTSTYNFADLLRRYRVNAGLSQEALAERAGLSVSGVAALERGRRTAPRPDTVALLADALTLDADERAALIAAAAPSPTVPPAENAGVRAFSSTLPTPPTPLIGREHEEAAVTHLLRQDGVRLLTLTGPGGVGKTRLATAVALDIQDVYADGVVFVDLSALRDPTLVLPIMAQTLGLREVGPRGIDALLLASLRPKHLLLVLDNFEQVVDAAPSVAELVAACPRLVALVTSRTALRVRAERQFRVRPLPVPAGDQPLPDVVGDYAGYAAVRLFEERARAAQPDFQVDAANVEAVARVCGRLDGLPLAIELAAARITLLPPAAMLSRLEQRLSLSQRGARDLPARQQTLRAAIDWSHDLLSEGDKALFRRLAVFAGGFTAAAAGAVCFGADVEVEVDHDSADAEVDHDGADAEVDHDGAALEGLASLLDRSLIHPVDVVAEEPRFGMLETIRAYALERLEVSGASDTVRGRHAAYVVSLAEAALPHFFSADRDVWLAGLDGEIDNLRAALTWSTVTTQADTDAGHGPVAASERRDVGLRLVGALAWYWLVRGRLREGRLWAEAALVGTDRTDRGAARGAALTGAGLLAQSQGDAAAAGPWVEESADIFRALGVTRRLAYALLLVGMTRVSRGELAAARPVLEEGCALHREVGNAWGEATTVYHLGNVAAALRDHKEARARYDESLAIFRRSGDALGTAVVLHALGAVAVGQGDDATAEALFAESLPLLRTTGDEYDLARALVAAGEIAVRRGDARRAHEALTEGLRLWRDIGLTAGAVRALAGLAGLASSQGRTERAGRLFGAAKALSISTGATPNDARSIDIDQLVAAAREQLDPPAFAAGWSAGLLMTEEQAISHALHDV